MTELSGCKAANLQVRASASSGWLIGIGVAQAGQLAALATSE